MMPGSDTGEASEWSLTDAALEAIESAIARFKIEYATPDFAYYPLIAWREGAWATRPGEPSVDLPDCYDLSLISREDISAARFIPLASARFGVVAFSPRDRDAASSRRLIDYGGEAIVVR